MAHVVSTLQRRNVTPILRSGSLYFDHDHDRGPNLAKHYRASGLTNGC